MKSCRSEKTVQQGCNGCFTIGSRNSDKLQLYAKLGILTDNRAFKNEWIVAQSAPKNILLESFKSYPDSMPDFTGMTGKDAVFLIEQMGMKPALKGNGQVVWQSVPSGSQKIKGQTIELKLNNL